MRKRDVTGANAEREDPGKLAQSLFARFEEKRGEPDGAYLAEPSPSATDVPGTPLTAGTNRSDLLAVVRNLEAVTASLVATSAALTGIAQALADEE